MVGGPALIEALASTRSVDVVHAHVGEDISVLPIARMAAVRHHAPLVVTVHSSPWLTVRPVDRRTASIHLLGGIAERRVLPRAERVLVLTDHAAGMLRRHGMSEVEVVPLGVDVDPFGSARPDPMPSAERPRIVCVARLVRSKGVDVLIRALGSVLGDHRLIVVGDGPQRAALMSLADEQGVGGRVRWVRSVPHRDVAAHLMHTDVAVLPSQYEEAGRCLIEAMAAGTPVVASRVGGIPSIVEEGVNGLLVPADDHVALGSAVERVLGDANLRRALTANGRATASMHGPEALTTAVLRSYRAVTQEALVPGRSG